MNKGSTRVTVRLGDDLIDMIDEAVQRFMEGNNPGDIHNRSDFIILAIRDKLNHGHRSAKRERQVQVTKVSDYEPRLVEED